MAGKHAQFKVDPRLAALLGESYRNTEQALKELIDNAWDADAEHLWISLPESMTKEPIVVRDDGTGMTEREVRSEYLNIARDRRSRRGDLSLTKKRQVKGRKGIGKFAGLVTAGVMLVETRACGTLTTLRIEKKQVLEAKGDLENVELPISTSPCREDESGTTITLTELNAHFSMPRPETLREMLSLEYGREREFEIFVNDERLAHEDIPGQKFSATIELPTAGVVTVNFTIMDHVAPKGQAGIVMRVGGKVVGKPGFLGLDENEELPNRLLRHVVGEVIADSLEDDVTADWGAIIENSVAYQEAREWIRSQLTDEVKKKFHSDVEEQFSRRQRSIDRRLAHLPQHRRDIANRQLQRVLQKFYGETPDRIDTVVNLMLDALEKDEYWLVCEHLNSAVASDVGNLAEALGEFGLVDLAVIAQQARRRLEFLDHLDALERNPGTLEKEMHGALDTNLWVFGPQYSMMATNKTLAATIEQLTGKKFQGKNASNRPDLFLAQDFRSEYLLIEFKRPSATVGRKAEAQAKEYRDELAPNFGHMEILVLGGTVDPRMQLEYGDRDLKFLSYRAVISQARSSLEWLLSSLNE